MSEQQPLMIRLLSASVAVANRAGAVIRDVLKSGQLGVVHKVRVVHDASPALVKTGACGFCRVTMIPRRRQTAEQSDASWPHSPLDSPTSPSLGRRSVSQATPSTVSAC